MVSPVPTQDELRVMGEPESRIYRRSEVVAFRRTGDAFGGLSNMAPGYPIVLMGHRIRTAEALYQACRFPHLPEVQRMIINEHSPMTAKMKAKPFRAQSRTDWDEVRVPIMKWCLRVKLASNWRTFSTLLLDTGDRPIVEDSRKDEFWGAKPRTSEALEGRNVLGRLLMQLRDQIRHDPASLHVVRPPRIDHFLLLSCPLEAVAKPPGQDRTSNGHDARRAVQTALL